MLPIYGTTHKNIRIQISRKDAIDPVDSFHLNQSKALFLFFKEQKRGGRQSVNDKGGVVVEKTEWVNNRDKT